MKLNRTNVRLLFITATIIGLIINSIEEKNEGQTKQTAQNASLKLSVIN
jgi:hypothetical protein